MLLNALRYTLVAFLFATIGVIMAGCGSTSSPGAPDANCDWVVGSGTSGADGLVTIDMGDLGTFHAKVRDGLTALPVDGAQYICVASACEDEASCFVVGGDDYQVGVFTYDRDDVITDSGSAPTDWDELFPWTGGDTPIPGIHGVAWVPEDSWDEIRASLVGLATDAINDMDDGLIVDELASRDSGLLLASSYPPGSSSVLVYVCWADYADASGVLDELKNDVYLAQGYCGTQEVRLTELEGPDVTRTGLGIPLIEPVVTAPGCVATTNLGTVYGVVRDAITGDTISGATVAVNGVQTVSGIAGSYTVSSVVPSDHVLVTASVSGYQPFSMTLVVGENASVQQDLVLVPSAMASDQYRFILTWGENPSDLDSHLWVPIGASQYYHVYFSDKGTLLGTPYAQLDVDDTTSFGPETVTLLPEYSGNYIYAIYEWAGEGTLATSSAVVQLYAGNNLTRVINVPTGACGENWWWYVGELNPQTGVFTLINELHEDPPTGSAPAAGSKEPVAER